jgi:hypothetical protein
MGLSADVSRPENIYLSLYHRYIDYRHVQISAKMKNILVRTTRDLPAHFTTLRIHRQHSGFHPSILSTSIACSTFLWHPVDPWMIQIGRDLSSQRAYFTSFPKISTSIPPSIYLRDLGPIASIQGFRPH